MGHLSFGYIAGKLTAQAAKVEMNVPIVLTLSVIPDIDILIPHVEHRGPSHSLLMAVIVFIPLFVLYGKMASPYFAALIQHSLIGDYIAGYGVQLLWPLTPQHFGVDINIRSPTNITLELSIFLVATAIMLKTKDLHALFQLHNSNLILAIPTFTVLLPTFLAFPLDVPSELILPHILYLILFLTSLLIDIRKIGRQALSKGAGKHVGKI